jgi:hypothetical protein
MGTKKQRTRALNWNRLALPNLEELPGMELDRPFTEDEIVIALKNLPSGKAPGPDGFTCKFYRHCWEIIKPDILRAFHSIFIQHWTP